MTGDEVSDVVLGAIIAEMVILRIVQAVNRRSTEYVFKLNHWELMLILCWLALDRILKAYGRHSTYKWAVVYDWLGAFVCMTVVIYIYFRHRRVKLPPTNQGGTPETD